MKARSIIFISLVLIALYILFFKPAFIVTGKAQLVLGQSTQKIVSQDSVSNNSIIKLVNSVRQAHKLKPLLENKTLDKVARAKADDLCNRNYWSHNDPRGRSWLYFFNLEKYNYTYAGENLAEGFTNPQSTVRGWVNSPEHYSNIIDPHYSETGIDTLVCKDFLNQTNVQISVNEFGRP